MKVGIVCGTFDERIGKASYFGEVLGRVLGDNFNTKIINGGNLSALDIDFKQFNALVWMPNISNDEDKILPIIKSSNPKMVLISSKRIIEKSYTDFDVVGRLLKSRSALGIAIRKNEEYQFKLIDPLGNCHIDTNDISTLAEALSNRLKEILTLTRVGSKKIGDVRPFEIDKDFLKFVEYSADEFSKYVNAINPERFLGNASMRSTRCTYGFPATKDGERIFVTRRNIDKRLIGDSGFVEVANNEDIVEYYGEHKPSVDTPIQVRLFNHYRNIKYIVHGHVYIDSAPYTESKVPCGFIEEFDEIVDLYEDPNIEQFVVNLKGHGCLILSNNVEGLYRMSEFKSRPFLEGCRNE